MKKINIMLFLVLAIALVACNLGKTGKKETAPKQTQLGTDGATLADKKAGEEKVGGEDEEDNVADNANSVEETEEAKANAAVNKLKTEGANYKKGMDDAKTEFEALDSSKQNKVSIPLHVTGLRTRRDQPKIHASLGYDNETIKNLNTAIKTLQLRDGKTEEIEIVEGVLKMLIHFDNSINEVFDEFSKENTFNLIKSENVLDEANAGLKEAIRMRDEFTSNAKEIIKTAASKKNPEDVKAELKKVIDLVMQ
ncbi:hypothetical protein [Borrelia sp. RT1S]|uniref:hypothetical protein n=1 Tax=Borrelia sp. RT1S TaxID=2898580 RepID=UPI001E3D7064|nr:hypothetical protein [Borrelia sp. RT1S]UGQ17968.1 hypothetical protein LSO05_05910 [Borrelia sp. RT1S]